MPQQEQVQNQVVQTPRQGGSILGSLFSLLAPFMPGGQMAAKGVQAVDQAKSGGQTQTTSQPAQVDTRGQKSSSSTSDAASNTVQVQQPAATPQPAPDAPAPVAAQPQAGATGNSAGRAVALGFLQNNPMAASIFSQNPSMLLGASGFFNELHQILGPMQDQASAQQQSQQNGGTSA